MTVSSFESTRSDKSVFLAAVLSLIFGLFGIQNLYMGHKKRFLINISLFALSTILLAFSIILMESGLTFPAALFMSVNIYWGLIDFIRIVSGHAKDSKGAYLLTEAGYKKKAAACSALHQHGAETVPQYTVSEIGIVRYELEHKLFRDRFFQNPEGFANILLKEDMVYTIYNNILSKKACGNPYRKEDFEVRVEVFEGNNFLIRVKLPVPEYTPLCHKIYLVIDRNENNAEYFTIEQGATAGFICCWKRGYHLNLHKIEDPQCYKVERAIDRTVESAVILEEYRKMRSSRTTQ